MRWTLAWAQRNPVKLSPVMNCRDRGVLLLLMRPVAALRDIVLRGLLALVAITLAGCSSGSNSGKTSVPAQMADSAQDG